MGITLAEWAGLDPQLTLVDLSEEALDLAKLNATALNVIM